MYDFDRTLEYLINACYTVPIKRPDWINFYLGLAFVIKERSADGQNKHACIITTKNYDPIGFGYNSFPKGMKDHLLPNIRPLKYKHMKHSERNSIDNCWINPKTFSDGCLAFVTGVCCYECASSLWQSNIKKIYCIDRNGYTLPASKDLEQKRDLEILCEHTGLEIIYIKPKLKWLVDLARQVEDLGFDKE